MVIVTITKRKHPTKHLHYIVSLLFFLLVLSLPSPIYAHKLLIEPIDSGIIKVVYEDGSFSTRTFVTVYDDNGEKIEVGSLDSNGYFHYDDKKAFSFVAEDGIGHRSEWQKDKQMVSVSDPHRWLIALAVLLISTLVAIYYSVKTRKKYNQINK